MTRNYIRAGELEIATDASLRALINDPVSESRGALDALYDKTVFASQAEALSGTSADKSMSPLRVRQALDNDRATRAPEVAVIRPTGGSGYINAGVGDPNTPRPVVWALNAESNVVWTVDDPTGIIRSVGTDLFRFDKPGLYRLSATLAAGRIDPEQSSFTLRIGFAFAGATSQPGGWFAPSAPITGPGRQSVATSTPPTPFQSGDGVGLVVACDALRSFQSDHRRWTRITIERLGPADGFGLASF